MRFSWDDKVALLQLIFDPTTEPSFEILKTCLVWPDERPVRISNHGYELLSDLWIVRGYMHLGIPSDKWGLDSNYLQEVWKQAVKDVPGWPGFRRLSLSVADRTYLVRCISEVSTKENY